MRVEGLTRIAFEQAPMSWTSILPLEAHDPDMYMAKPGSTALYAKENKRFAWHRKQRNSSKALLPASALEP